MFLVVFGHVLFQSIGLNEGESYLNMVLASFRMPMFFFVSGIVAYKPIEKWTKQYTLNILKRKFQAQIIGTIFFYTMLLLAIHADDPFRAFRLHVGGYWFTLTLFRIFFIYTILNIVFKHISEHLVFIFILVLSIFGAYIFKDKIDDNFWFSIVGNNTLYFLQFFLCGLCLRKYGLAILDKVTKGNYLSFIFIIFCALSILSISYEKETTGMNSWFYYILSSELIRYVGLIFVFGLFYQKRTYFEKKNILNNSFRLIGRRTLDIYFLHYFFLPDMQWIKGYITFGSNEIVPQLTIGFILASVIIAICLGISTILRISPFLSQWLFGVKGEPNSSSTITSVAN